MSMQKEAYCRDGRHEESKRRGKLRTKYNRLAWGVHVLNELYLCFLRHKEMPDFDMSGSLL